MVSNCPCKDCTKRHFGCHKECELYKNWRKELDQFNEMEQRAKRYASWDIPNKKGRQI